MSLKGEANVKVRPAFLLVASRGVSHLVAYESVIALMTTGKDPFPHLIYKLRFYACHILCLSNIILCLFCK